MTTKITNIYRIALHSLRLWLALLLIAGLTSCDGVMADAPPPPAEAPVKGEKGVYLTLSVTATEAPLSSSTTTRTFPEGEDVTFEGPASDREKINTLRVIIVRPDAMVEWNRMLKINPATGAPTEDNLEFLVRSGEKKRIYLIANEKGASLDWNLDEIKMNNKADTTRLRALKIKRQPGAALGGTAALSAPVPMSEVFTVDVPANQSDEDIHRSVNLFVTRAAIKFSFCLICEDSYSEKGVKVKEVGIRGFADEEYLIPRDAIYSPGKYDPAASPSQGREIISFSTSESNSFSGYNFPLPQAQEIKKGLNYSFSPQIYFPETKRKVAGTNSSTGFPIYEDLGITLLMEGEGTQYLTAVPLKLTEIARNTHVKVNIYLRSTGVTAVAEVLPYTGVSLNPSFGL